MIKIKNTNYRLQNPQISYKGSFTYQKLELGVLGQNGNVAKTVETQLRPEIEHVIHQMLTMMLVVHFCAMEMKLKPVTALQDAAHVSEL